EILEHSSVELLRDVVGRDQRQRLGPLQRGTLAGREKRRLLPRRYPVQALLDLPFRSRILRVHVDAVRATVDLRDARLDQMRQLPLDAALTNDLFQTVHGLQSVRVLRDLDSLRHDQCSSTPGEKAKK